MTKNLKIYQIPGRVHIIDMMHKQPKARSGAKIFYLKRRKKNRYK